MATIETPGDKGPGKLGTFTGVFTPSVLTIGLVLFLAQSVSIAFYCIGFAEAVSVFFTDPTAMTTWLIAFGAVTGFTQGVSMSGDLADPGKSLPLGTFLAVGISLLVYFATALVFSAAMPNAQLAVNYGAMKSVARYGFLIDAGVIAATLSSAMALPTIHGGAFCCRL